MQQQPAKHINAFCSFCAERLLCAVDNAIIGITNAKKCSASVVDVYKVWSLRCLTFNQLRPVVCCDEFLSFVSLVNSLWKDTHRLNLGSF